jgi:anti-sigma factor RsiW
MLSCKQTADLASDYHDGEMEPGRTAEFEQHLDHCPPCNDFYQSFDTTIRLARSAVMQEVPPGLAEAVLAGVREKLAAG